MRFKINVGMWRLVAIIIALAAAPTWAQFKQSSPSGDAKGIDITADKLSTESGGNKIEATGNVEIKRQQTTIKADEARVDRQTQDMEAKGKVSMDDPEWKIKSADAVQMNLEKETGEIQNGDLFLEQGQVSMMGSRLQKFGGQVYHIDDGFFTTCLCESGPVPWRVSADQIDLDREGSAVVRHAYFYVFDIPVLYIPYAVLPLKTERETGFLIPKTGYSNTDGFRFQQPFFWAISKSTDATAAFDVETKTRIGLLGEFRTIFNQYSDFRLDSSYFNESWRTVRTVGDPTIADTHIPISRWSVIGTHRYTTANDWLTYSDIAAYSDSVYTRELIDRYDLPRTQEANAAVSRYGLSRFGAFRSWGDTYFNANLSFYQDFVQFAKQTLQATPELSFWGRRFLDGFPLEFRWNMAGVNYWRRVGGGGDGLRMDIKPEFIVPFRVSNFFFGSLNIAPRETLYHLYRAVEPNLLQPQTSGDRNISRELVEIRYNIGTSLNRVFTVNSLGLSAVKHIIEPELSYLFVPPVNQSAIPIMDNIDRIQRRNVFTFAVTNRLWGKPANPLASVASEKDIEMLTTTGFATQDMASLRLALSYNVNAASSTNGNKKASDLDMNFRVNPTNYLNFLLDGGLGTGPWQISQVRATFSISDPRPIVRRVLDADFLRPNSFSAGYQFLRNNPNGFLTQDANINLNEPPNCGQNPLDPRCPGGGLNQNVLGSVNSSTFYHLTDNILVTFSAYYDLINKTSIGLHGGAKYLSSCECWTVTVNVNQQVNPAKTGFSFNFNLLGLGQQNSQQSALR
jgi:LPS-assembly protein